MTPLRALATIAAFIIETVAVCYIITVVVVADKQDCYKGDVVAVGKHRGEHYSLSIEDYDMVIVRPSYLTVGGV